MKAKNCISIFALGLLAFPFAFVRNVKVTQAIGDYSNIPGKGEVSEDSYYINSWFDTVGARRISDAGVIVSDQPGWGYRGKISGKKFDLKSFYFAFDVSNLPNYGTLMVMIANGEGSYCNSEDNMMSIDIVKHSTLANTFCMTVDTHSKSHAVSLPGFTDGTEWADDGTYKGITLEAVDGVISFKIQAVSGTTSNIIVNNDRVFPVENDDLFALCSDSTAGYVAIGSYSGSARYSFIINEIGDAATTEYYASGAFYQVKNGLTQLEAMNYSTATNEVVLNAKLQYDALPVSDLYRWDVAYFQARLTAAKAALDAALLERGNEIQLDLLENKVQALTTATASLDTVAKVDSALAAKDACDEVIGVVNGLTLSDSQTVRFNGLLVTYNEKVGLINAGIEAVYEAAVAAYEAKAAAGLQSGLEYSESLTLRNAIPYKYNTYISVAKAEAFDARVQAASDTIEASTTLTHDNWIQGTNARVITTANGTIDLVSSGNFNTRTPQESTGVFLKEALNVLDFELKFKVLQIPEATGSWLTIGFMQNCEPWIHSGRDVTENTGIFFLLTRVDSSTMMVEAHLNTIACTEFFDSTLVQTITTPFNAEVTLKFTTEQKTIAGVTDTYFVMSFNDVKFEQDVITSRKIKTAIQAVNGQQKGYLQVGSSGYSKYNPAVISILEINGFSPLAASVAKQQAEHQQPTSTTTSVTFISGSQNGKATFNLDLHGEALTAVKVDGAAIAQSNYSFDSNKLILNNAYCNTLSSGDHTVVAETSGGNISWKLTVVGGSEGQGGNEGEDTPSEQPSKKKGCGGSIIATSAIISAVSLLGAILMSYKKKEK